MPLLLKRTEGELAWGIWKMEPAPGKNKRTLETESVNALLADLCGMPKPILHEENGQPYLEDHSFHISVSHTKGYAAVALHPRFRVGIDIEHFGMTVYRVREKFMQEDELEEADVEDIYQLLLYWSAKEAVYKVLSMDGVELRRHIRIFPFEMEEEEGELNAIELKTGTRKEFPVKYLLDKEFVLTYTVDELRGAPVAP